jgi:hypothetical protein
MNLSCPSTIINNIVPLFPMQIWTTRQRSLHRHQLRRRHQRRQHHQTIRIRIQGLDTIYLSPSIWKMTCSFVRIFQTQVCWISQRNSIRTQQRHFLHHKRLFRLEFIHQELRNLWKLSIQSWDPRQQLEITRTRDFIHENATVWYYSGLPLDI